MRKIILLFCMLISLCACSDWSEDNKKHTRFHYGDGVKIKDGFFKDYECVVLQEYPKGCTIFCELQAFIKNDVENAIQEKYVRRINIDCNDVEMVK
jgi:hypothetical protein